MQESFKIYLIGFSGEEFPPKVQSILRSVDHILVAERLAPEVKSKLFPSENRKVIPYRKLSEALACLQKFHKEGKPLAFIASGDPLFFGIGKKLLEKFGPEALEIHPALSFPQQAFARLRIPWEDFFFVSLHGSHGDLRPFHLEDLPGLLRLYGKLCVFTDPENSPARIAAYLQERVPQKKLQIFVAERLNLPGERLVSGSPEEIARKSFRDPNLMLLIYEGPGRKRLFGLSSAEILHPRGLLTKDEVRAVVLHKLKLPEKGVLWDVGAGAGGVSCEVALTFPLLRVLSIEREAERLNYLRQNRERLGLLNLEPVEGEAPEALKDLPSPDRVFVGGSGGRLVEILEVAAARLNSGPLVLGLTLLEHLHQALEFLKSHGLFREVVEIQVSRSRTLGEGLHLRAENPVFVVVGEKR